MKTPYNKHVWAVLITILTIITLAGCSPADNTKPTEEPNGFIPSLDQQISSTLNVVGHYSNFESLEEEFNLFSQYYPNVKLRYTYLEDYNKNISLALASDEAPDIFFTFPWMIGNKTYMDLFNFAEDLSAESLKIDLSVIRDRVLYKDTEGHIFMVPIFSSTNGMLINEDIFEKEKISIPNSYESFLSACEALQKAGYKSPVMSYTGGTFLLFPLYYPLFCSEILGNETAVSELNAMKPGAGEYMRSALERAVDFMNRGYIDLEECSGIENDYNAVIMRFFEGDVPMMLGTANTVSGTEKRESQSDAFTAHPFKYSFHPVPSTEKGGFFVENVSLGFSVNKNSENLDIANEFIRFIVSSDELNRMAQSKRMVTPAKNMSLDGIYASFGEVEHISQSDVGILDAVDIQVRTAGSRVCKGEMTIDEAIAAYGTLSEK